MSGGREVLRAAAHTAGPAAKQLVSYLMGKGWNDPEWAQAAIVDCSSVEVSRGFSAAVRVFEAYPASTRRPATLT